MTATDQLVLATKIEGLMCDSDPRDFFEALLSAARANWQGSQGDLMDAKTAGGRAFIKGEISRWHAYKNAAEAALKEIE